MIHRREKGTKVGVEMSDSQWAAGPGDTGVRLDKFLAAPDRLGSRPRAATALERGKVFVNGEEAGIDAAGRRRHTRDIVGRRQSGGRRCRCVRHGGI